MSLGGDGRPDEQTRRRLTWLRRGVAAMLLAGVLAFLVEGADQPPDPVLLPAGEEAQTRSDESAAPVAPVAPVDPPPPDDVPGSTTTEARAPSTTAPEEASTAPPQDAEAGPGPSTRSVPAPERSPSSTVTTTTTVAAPPPRRPLAGFDEVAFRIRGSGGGTFDGVALLADDASSRGQGLMEQTDLRGYDGMVFRFDAPSTGTFFMRNTRIPLSIAFFDGAGRFVSSTDMVPCPDSVEDCPSYAAAGPYVHAIEVAAGDLPRLGIGPGAVLSFPSR